MSKVIHLSDEAHSTAKDYCKSRGMRMSDWVASLILDSVRKAQQPEPPPVTAEVEETRRARAVETARVHARRHAPRPLRAAGVKKKILSELEEKSQVLDDGTPVWAAPPFWNRKER